MEELIQFTRTAAGQPTIIHYKGENIGKITCGGRVWIETDRDLIAEKAIMQINREAFYIRQQHIRWWQAKPLRQQYEMLLDRLPCDEWLSLMKNTRSMSRKVEVLFDIYMKYYS